MINNWSISPFQPFAGFDWSKYTSAIICIKRSIFIIDGGLFTILSILTDQGNISYLQYCVGLTVQIRLVLLKPLCQLDWSYP